MILENINGPEDLKALHSGELKTLSAGNKGLSDSEAQ